MLLQKKRLPHIDLRFLLLISIHALRAEGDHILQRLKQDRGISIHARRE